MSHCSGCVSLILLVTSYNFYTYRNNQVYWQRQWHVKILEINRWWDAKPVSAALYRSSMLKSHILPFDFNWLGDLKLISKTLDENGWESLPQLTLESSLMFLAENPSAKLIPVFPRFHRDRLPTLVVTKILKEQPQRIVLQLWISDFITTSGMPIWAGTIRIERVENRVPFLTFYLENIEQVEANKYIRHFLKSIRGKWKYKRIQSPNSLYLIAPQ